MRVIISGGTGSVGVPLSNELATAGHEVIVLSRNPANAPATLHDAVEVTRWDAKSGDGWYDKIDADTAIVNLAGKNPANWRWTTSHKQQVLDSRLNAAQAVIDAIQRADEKPSVLLQASAVGYYGNTGQSETYESAPAGDTWRAAVCIEWEHALKPVEAMGIRVAYLRIGIVLDTKAGALPPFILAGHMLGRQLGTGTQWIPWIHNDDVSGSIHYLMENDTLSGFFNLTAPNPAQNREFLKTLTGVISRPSIFPVPAFALKIAMGEMSKTVLDSQRILPQALLDGGYPFRFPTLEPALRDLL